MNHRVTSQYRITYPDGEVWHAQTTDHGDIPDHMVAVFSDGYDDVAAKLRKHKDDFNKEDDVKLNVTASATMDGTTVASLSESGISYRTAHEFLRAIGQFGDELRKHGDKRAKEHAQAKKDKKDK